MTDEEPRCRATLTLNHRAGLTSTYDCARPAGHYDGPAAGTHPAPGFSTTSWHEGTGYSWLDTATGAIPHRNLQPTMRHPDPAEPLSLDPSSHGTWIDLETLDGWIRRLDEGAEEEGGGPAALAADHVATELRVWRGMTYPRPEDDEPPAGATGWLQGLLEQYRALQRTDDLGPCPVCGRGMRSWEFHAPPRGTLAAGSSDRFVHLDGSECRRGQPRVYEGDTVTLVGLDPANPASRVIGTVTESGHEHITLRPEPDCSCGDDTDHPCLVHDDTEQEQQA